MSDTNPSSSSAGYDWHNAGVYFGNFATVCFTLQYIPQAIKNYKRQSVQGFSTSGIIMKLLGAAFLTINAYILGEAPPVILYGLFNVIQHSIFVVQFAIYNKNLAFLPWILFPVFPFWLATTYPQTIVYTNSIKPIAQVLSHFPQLWVCIKMQSVAGVSMLTQHLNLFGGVAGLLMTLTIIPKTYATYLIYLNSCAQALSLYVVGLKYEGWGSLQCTARTYLTFGLSEVSAVKTAEN